MKFKKILISLLPICLIFVLTACNCEHEWSEATCVSLRTCNICGVTEGDYGEHDFAEANCTTPKRCKICSEIEGEALGHKYIDGFCRICYADDPNYIDLNKFGFANMHGMNVWLEVSGYDFGNNLVYVTSNSSSDYVIMDFYIFSGSYFQFARLSNRDTGPITSITADMLDGYGTTVYNVISNDVISYNSSEDGTGTFTINDRVVDSNNSKLIMKTSYEAFWDEDEYWLVPVDLLDFSTLKFNKIHENNSSYVVYSINFK